MRGFATKLTITPPLQINSSRGDIDKALDAFRASLAECGYKA